MINRSSDNPERHARLMLRFLDEKVRKKKAKEGSVIAYSPFARVFHRDSAVDFIAHRIAAPERRSIKRAASCNRPTFHLTPRAPPQLK